MKYFSFEEYLAAVQIITATGEENTWTSSSQDFLEKIETIRSLNLHRPENISEIEDCISIYEAVQKQESWLAQRPPLGLVVVEEALQGATNTKALFSETINNFLATCSSRQLQKVREKLLHVTGEPFHEALEGTLLRFHSKYQQKFLKMCQNMKECVFLFYTLTYLIRYHYLELPRLVQKFVKWRRWVHLSPMKLQRALTCQYPEFLLDFSDFGKVFEHAIIVDILIHAHDVAGIYPTQALGSYWKKLCNTLEGRICYYTSIPREESHNATLQYIQSELELLDLADDRIWNEELRVNVKKLYSVLPCDVAIYFPSGQDCYQRFLGPDLQQQHCIL